jgi:hypothetical protein
MSQVSGNSRERIVQLDTAVNSAAPVRGTLPSFLLSPRSSRGYLTQGFAFSLTSPSAGGAVASNPGFTVTIYRVAPTLSVWNALQAFTAANYLDQLVFPDISGGMSLYFQITNVSANGLILLGVAELD